MTIMAKAPRSVSIRFHSAAKAPPAPRATGSITGTASGTGLLQGRLLMAFSRHSASSAYATANIARNANGFAEAWVGNPRAA